MARRKKMKWETGPGEETSNDRMHSRENAGAT